MKAWDTARLIPGAQGFQEWALPEMAMGSWETYGLR